MITQQIISTPQTPQVLQKQHYIQRSIYDLAAFLYLPQTVFSKQIEDKWVLYAPDYPGMPVVMTHKIKNILDQFSGGRAVSDVIAQVGDFSQTLVTIGFLEEKGFLRSTDTRLPYSATFVDKLSPLSLDIWIHITEHCNLSCKYCFVGEKSLRKMSNDRMEFVVKAISNTAALYQIKNISIKFAGGEPTLFIEGMKKFRSLLEEELAHINVNLNTSVLSNGTVLSRKLIDFLKHPNTGLGISIDGYREAHDIYRRFSRSDKGSWVVIEKTLKELKKQDIKPLIMATISQKTAQSLPKLVRWIHENALRTRLSIVKQPECSWENWESGDQECEQEYNSLSNDLSSAFDAALTELEDPLIHIDICNQLEICELSFDRPTTGAPCGIGLSYITIKTDGTVAACPMMVGNPGIQISNNDLLATAHQCFTYSRSKRQKNEEQDSCLNCLWFPVCSGGCPITNLRVNGHPFSKSPLCHFYRSVIPRYMEFVGRKIIQAERPINACDSYQESAPHTSYA